MKKMIALTLAGGLLLAVPAGLTLAQSTSTPDTSATEGQAAGEQGREGRRGWHRQPPSPEMLQRMLDGRLAGAKTALRLTPQQEPLWPAVEKVIRDNAAERMAFMQKMRGEREKRSERPDLMERLDTMGDRMATRSTQVKKLAEALRPLYATLSDEQKDVLRHEIRHAMGGGMRHGGMMRGHHRG